MRKKMKLASLLICGFAAIFLFTNSISSTDFHSGSDKEQLLIKHLKYCIDQGSQEKSKLSNSCLEIEGMSSPKVRHFLNNLCSLPETNYLEIGVWKGSTFVSALYENELSIKQACAIDDWSTFGGPLNEFQNNCSKFLSNEVYHLYSQDSFKFDLSNISRPINVYFYDGEHTAKDQELAFTYYNDIFDDVFIAVVDDWNFPEVPQGTFAAFEKLNYEILFQRILPASHNCDRSNWWNGLYVAVIRKK